MRPLPLPLPLPAPSRDQIDVTRQPPLWLMSETVEMTFLPFCSTFTCAVAVEPVNVIASTVSVESSLVFS